MYYTDDNYLDIIN